VIADLQDDASRLRRLIDDLLELERASGAPAPHEEVRLDRMVAEMSADHPQVSARVGGPVTVTGEPAALSRSIENLLENAVVHGPTGGRIEIALNVENSAAEVAVSDEGPGFVPGEEEEAFGRFWRSEGAKDRPGSGIGLAIVRATAERHGGSVRAKGSTVTVTLPLAE
jgi:signal transduction histidine kinase